MRCEYCKHPIGGYTVYYAIKDDQELQRVCGDCISDEFVKCDACDTYYHEDDVTTTHSILKNTTTTICPDCKRDKMLSEAEAAS